MNIYNQNVAFNYRGILNLDATTINTPLDTTLRAVTDGMGTSSLLQLSTEAVGLSRTVNLSAGATTPRLFNVAYTINNSGAQTGTLTGIFLNATETALNGMTHNLMDLQIGGVSRFKVDRAANISAFGTIYGQGYYGLQADTRVLIGGSLIRNNSTGVLTLMNSGETDFGRLQLGGTTSSFPAIKRNGTAIDFRLADDSGYCSVNANNFITSGLMGLAPNYLFSYGTGFVRLNGSISGMWVEFNGSTALNASAIFGINSTTQGFLMPRMTQAQILLIALPANGLQVYNTDINTPCFYDGTGWRKVTHSTM